MKPDGSPFRRHRFALAFLFAIALTLFIQPLIKQEVFTLRDHFDYFQPLRWFTAEELKEGRLPLWNPYSASGEPWLANPQTGVFYPPAWLFLVLPFATAYMLFLFIHLVILGWGAYLLFARTGSRGAALVGAVAIMFSGPLLSLLDVSNNLTTLAWLPVALWCAAAGAWRRGGIAIALSFLAGEPFFAAVIALSYVIVCLSTAERSRGSERLRVVVLSALVAFGLSAVQLLPFLEMVRGSDRAAGLGAAQVLRDSMPLRDWPRIALPPKAGESGFDPALGQEYIPVVYMGIGVVLLAGIGLAGVRGRSDLAGWLVLLAVCVVLSAGPAILAALPLTPFRYPARLVALAVFPLAALAAAGWDRVRRERRWLDLLVVLIVLADLAPRARPLLATAPFDPHPVPYDASIGATSKLLRVGSIEPANRPAWIAGYLNLYDRRFDANTAAPAASKRYLELHQKLIEAPTPDLVSQTGIGYLVTKHAGAMSLTPVAKHEGVVVYSIPGASAMADHRSADGSAVTAASWKAGTSRADLAIDAPSKGMLVLRQQASKGWQVFVDGERAKATDAMFLSVEVEKGRHEVVWRYRPMSLYAGSIFTLVTLLALQLSRFVKHSRKKSQRKNFLDDE